MALTPYFTPPTLSGNIYPPLDSKIATPVTDWTTLQHGTQTLCSLLVDGVNTLPNFMFGFRVGSGENISVKENGAIQSNTTSLSSLLTLTSDKVIYGYSYGPNYFDLWTDPNYIDQSRDILYGKRGLYVKLANFTDWDYSIPTADLKPRGCFLFGYNNAAICLTAEQTSIDNSTLRYVIGRGLTGEYLQHVELPLKLRLKSEVISTLPIETIVSSLSDEVKKIDGEIDNINSTLDALVPDITKLVNAESSKYYVAR